MNAPLSRRSLLGASTAAVGAVSLVGMSTSGRAATAEAGVLSTNDARLVAIAAELEAVDRRMALLGEIHGEAEELPEWKALLGRYEPLTVELEELPADTMIGLLAKARAMQVPTVSDSLHGIGNGIALDLLRLGAGALA